MGLWSKKWAAVAIAVVAPLSLSGCLILPGEFASAMTVRKNGDFSFSYKGQIQLIGLATLLNNEVFNEGSKGEFKAVCYTDSIEPVSENNDLKVEVERDDVATHTDTIFAAVPASYWITLASQDPPTSVEEAARAAEEAAEFAAKATDDAAKAAADAVAGTEWDSNERECTPAEIKQQKAD